MNEPEILLVDPAELSVDPQVQRTIDTTRVKHIADRYDPTALGVLKVSRRPDGTMVVLDGQHRLAAVKAVDPDRKLRCEVYTDLSLTQEARAHLQGNDTRRPQAIDLFKVRVTAGNETAVAITTMLAKYGWRVRLGAGEGDFAAVVGLERVWRTSATAAEAAIKTATEAWGNDPAGAAGALIEGLGLFHLRYGQQVNMGDLVGRLKKYAGGPGALIGKARGLRDMRGGTMPKAVGEIVYETYNARRRTTPLEPWRV